MYCTKKKQLQAFYTLKKQLQAFYTIRIKKIIFSMFLSNAIGENKTFYYIIYLFIVWWCFNIVYINL